MALSLGRVWVGVVGRKEEHSNGQRLRGWTEPDLPLWGQSFCSFFPQTQGSSSVTLDLIVPFLRPGGCVLVRNPALTLHILPCHLYHR